MTIQLWGPTLQFARGVPVTEHRREYSSYFIWKINVWFSISVEQTSNVEFVTGVQLLDSGMCSWISSLSGSFTSIGFYRVFSRFPVLYSRSILMLQFSVLRNVYVSCSSWVTHFCCCTPSLTPSGSSKSVSLLPFWKWVPLCPFYFPPKICVTFYILLITDITYLSSSVWLTSPNTITARSLYVPANGIICCFLMTE